MDKMREEFEKWFNRDYHPDKTGPYMKNALLFAWQAAHKSAVPDGYCVVPVEPTRDMVTSGNNAMAYDCCTGDAGDAWRAMIADRPIL